MHPRMHTDAYTRTGMHTPGPRVWGRIPGGMEYEIHATRDGAYGPVDYTTPLPGGLTFAGMLAATRAAADATARHARRRRGRTGPDHRIGHRVRGARPMPRLTTRTGGERDMDTV